MLRSGGNAIDAAAAIQFALIVVEPEFSGIGSGGFMMVHLRIGLGPHVRHRRPREGAGHRRYHAAPTRTAATRVHAGLDQPPAVGVPGTLKVVVSAVQRYGNKRLAEVIRPAIELAEDGFPVDFVLVGSASSSRTNLYQSTRKVFRPGGEPVQEGRGLLQVPEPILGRDRLLADLARDIAVRDVAVFALHTAAFHLEHQVAVPPVHEPGGQAALLLTYAVPEAIVEVADLIGRAAIDAAHGQGVVVLELIAAV
jgi:hypothetical protein